jgi:hypothetical protein
MFVIYLCKYNKIRPKLGVNPGEIPLPYLTTIHLFCGWQQDPELVPYMFHYYNIKYIIQL